MARLMKILFVVILVLLESNCTRKMDNPAQLKFDLTQLHQGKVGSLGGSGIDFVALNISGPGMDRVICRYDEDDNEIHRWYGPCGGDSANPLSVSVNNIPSGSHRLIQVLVVEEEETADGTEKEYFNYGDAVQNLVGGPNTVGIQLTRSQAETDKEGTAMGRYLLNGNGYTGKVALEYQPDQPGRPPMEVFHLEMFAGWFQIFLLSNIPLQYRFLNGPAQGHVMFNQPVNQTSSLWAPGPYVMNITSPKTYSDDGSETGEFQVLGFWNNGAPVSSNICYDNSVFYSDYEYTDAPKTISLSFPNDFTIEGGAGTCALIEPLLSDSHMNFGGDLVLDSHGDSILYQGPYMVYPGKKDEASAAEAYASGNQLTVNWTYLPGAVSAPELAGTSVFYSDSYTGNLEREFEGSGGFNCQKLLERVEDNFQVYHAASGVESVSFDAGREMAHKGVVIICPRKSSTAAGENPYFTSAAGAGVGKAPAVSLEISGPGFDYPYLNDNSCSLMEITAVDANGNVGELEASSENPYGVTLTDSGGGNFFDNPFCDQGGSPVVTIPMQGSDANVWYLVSTTPGTPLNPSVAALDNQGVTLTGDTWSGLQNQSPAAGVKLEVMVPEELYNTYECFPIVVAHTDANGVPVSAGAVTVNMSSSLGSDFYNYADPNCASSTDQQLDLSSGRAYAFFFYKPNTAGAEVTDVITATDVGSIASGTGSVDYLRPPDADYMYVDSQGALSIDTCHELYINTYISNGGSGPSLRSYPPENLLYQISLVSGSSNIQFYDNAGDCSGDTNSMNQFPQTANETGVTVYFKTPDNMSYSISVDELSRGDVFDRDKTFSVDP